MYGGFQIPQNSPLTWDSQIPSLGGTFKILKKSKDIEILGIRKGHLGRFKCLKSEILFRFTPPRKQADEEEKREKNEEEVGKEMTKKKE